MGQVGARSPTPLWSLYIPYEAQDAEPAGPTSRTSAERTHSLWEGLAGNPPGATRQAPSCDRSAAPPSIADRDREGKSDRRDGAVPVSIASRRRAAASAALGRPVRRRAFVIVARLTLVAV